MIYLPTERAIDAVKAGMKDDYIFTNSRGQAWTCFAVCSRFIRIQEATGIRINQYSLRHTFITQQLLAGVDSHVVATLAGHSNT